ncbi:helix-turn-helix transcriptional regulator [Bacillus sp. AF62]|uniref:helix-turn-helix transcriptional regulator n=1 Tax=Bacillus sp. AF62 TaxID=3158960 RepID=UPI00398F7F9C
MKQTIIYHKIAKHCGVTERYIRMLDKKERIPSMEVAKKISDFLDEPIEEIFLIAKRTKCSYLSGFIQS